MHHHNVEVYIMTRLNQERVRDERKAAVISLFNNGDSLYTNKVAKGIGVVWPVADRLLQDLVKEGIIEGDKVAGYKLAKKIDKTTLRYRIKKFLRV
jgi:Mn-dependent DtxR family transcriptional regulator